MHHMRKVIRPSKIAAGVISLLGVSGPLLSKRYIRLIVLVAGLTVGLLAAASCGGEGTPPPADGRNVEATIEAAITATSDVQATITASIAATVAAPVATVPGATEDALPTTQVSVRGPTPTPTPIPQVEQTPSPINLDLGMEGEGFGRIDVSAGATNFTCGDPRCLLENVSAAVVTMVALPVPGSVFQGWSVIDQPGLCPGTGPCDLAIGQDDVGVSASFGLSGATVFQPSSETGPAQSWQPTAAIARAARAVHCALGATTDYSGVALQRTGIDYSGQDLRGTDFEGQDLTCDNFAGTNLQGANLTHANLSYTNFEGADLRNADLFFASTLLTNAANAIWLNTQCPKGFIAMEDGAAPADLITECPSLTPGDSQPYPEDDQFSEARLLNCPPGSGEDLAALDLSGADFEGRDLSCADLTYADLSSANLRGANLSGALMWGTNLRNADLTSATLRHAWLNSAKFHNSLLRNANFDDTNLFFTDLTGADVTGARIQNVVWGFETHCGDGGYPWPAGETFEIPTGLECPGRLPVGPPKSLPDDYPSTAGVIGGVTNRGLDIAPVKTFAVWDQCPHVITEAEVTPYIRACVKAYTDAGIIYLSYIPISGVEAGSLGQLGIAAAYPELYSDAAFVDFDGTIDQSGVYNLFSNSSDIWLDFMIGVLKTQVDAGMTGIGFDEGWGNLSGFGSDFSPPAMEEFRQYLEGRYNTDQLAQKGITDISTFNYRDEFDNISRPLLDRDFQYYHRLRLREIYTRIGDEIKPYAAAKGQPWYLSSNIYDNLGWGNAAVIAPVLDLPMGEMFSDRGWPARNWTSFYKNMAALGKRYNSMGGDLEMGGDLVLLFTADVHATGGVSQHPSRGPYLSDVADPFYQLIQAHESFFTETDNRVALYYSLGNHMGDVDRDSVEVNTYYGAARLLEDSHYSYDVLYQGDPDMGPGTVRWVGQQVSLADM